MERDADVGSGPRVTRRRAGLAMLWLASLASFIFINLGNIFLLEALITQGLAILVLATALPLAPDSAFKQQWFAFAVGEHGGLMALSLVLLILGGGTAIEQALALALSIASLAVLVVALRGIRRQASFPAARLPASSTRAGARRRIDPYFHETPVPKGARIERPRPAQRHQLAH